MIFKLKFSSNFDMSRVLFVFALTANVIKGPNSPDAPIVVQENNVSLSDIILIHIKTQASMILSTT